MRDKTDDEIQAVRMAALQDAIKTTGEDMILLDSFFGTSDMSHALEYLGESLKLMAQADVVYFAPRLAGRARMQD